MDYVSVFNKNNLSTLNINIKYRYKDHIDILFPFILLHSHIEKHHIDNIVIQTLPLSPTQNTDPLPSFPYKPTNYSTTTLPPNSILPHNHQGRNWGFRKAEHALIDSNQKSYLTSSLYVNEKEKNWL